MPIEIWLLCGRLPPETEGWGKCTHARCRQEDQGLLRVPLPGPVAHHRVSASTDLGSYTTDFYHKEVSISGKYQELFRDPVMPSCRHPKGPGFPWLPFT